MKKRESQYTDEYLNLNRELFPDGWTIGTFLHHRLHGAAKSYTSRYHRALERACERRVSEGRARKGLSARRRTAYYPVSQ